MTKTSIAFFGSSPNSTIVLKELIKRKWNVSLVVTAPPKPVGRKQTLTKTPVHQFAEKHKIPLLTPESLSALKVEPFKVDVAIVADYAKIIPKKLLEIPKHGFLNLHPSLLPKYRGSTPAQAAILNGDKVTGLSIIKMDEKLDHGPIVAWFKEEIRNNDTSQSLYQRLFEIGAQVLTTILSAYLEGKITSREQDHSQATYAKKLTRQDGFIPWKTLQKATAEKKITSHDLPQALKEYLLNTNFNLQNIDVKLLERAIRAFHPWPGVWTTVQTKKGEKRLKIISAQPKKDQLVLNQVQIEGSSISKFNEIKNKLGN